MRGEQGVTVAELAATLMLLTIISGMTYRAVAVADRAAARSMAYRLAGYLRLVRQEAVARSSPCWVEFVGQGQFAMYCGTSPTAGPVRPAEAVGSEIRILPPGGRMGYQPQGLPVDPVSQHVDLRPRTGGITWRVTLNGQSGEVVVTTQQ